MRLVLATRNAHKLGEFATLLRPHEIVELPAAVALPPETAGTFAGNALEKARAAARATGLPAIADDSGIESAALGGAPGVRSARFAGEHATDEANLAKLLRSVPLDKDRRAYYVCALVWVEPSGEEAVFVERCNGLLTDPPRGQGGFGYDPAFIPVALDGNRTMAELSPAEKDAISHRGLAARAFLDWLDKR